MPDPRRSIPTPCKSLRHCPAIATSTDAPVDHQPIPSQRLNSAAAPFVPLPRLQSDYRSAVDFAHQAGEAHFWTPFGSQQCSSYELMQLLSASATVTQRCQGPRIPLDLHPFLHAPPSGERASTVAALARAAQLLSIVSGGVFFMTPCPFIWGMQLSEATLAALKRLQGPALHFTALPAGSCVHLYTDGSQTDSKAGWAVVVLVQLPEHRWLFQGVLAASSRLGIFGELLHTSGEAEAAGICAALSWALSLPSHVPFRVHTDCDWARCSASGSWSQGSKLRKGSTFSIARQLTLLHQALERDFALLPVRSHLGHPWNDLADAAAKMVSISEPPSLSPLTEAWKTVLQSDVAPWLWLLPVSRWHSAIPTAWALAVDSPPPDAPALDSCTRQFAQVLDLDRSTGGETHVSLRCSFVSFNVTTLRSVVDEQVHSQAATRTQGAQALLQHQFFERGVTFVGLQETRVPASSAYASGPFLVLSASADEAGQGGVALWVNTQQAYAVAADGRELFLQQKHCIALHADPRRLFVKICAPAINTLLCVWHAPHSMRPSNERVLWWQETEQILRSLVKPDDEVILMLDANARVGSCQGPAVGLVGAEKESHNGTLLREFLEAWRLTLPATSPVHAGQHWTWTSPHGTHARIDYVAVPQDWAPSVVSSSVLVDIEHAQLRDDHLPVLVTLEATRFCNQPFDTVTGRKDPDLGATDRWSQGLATGRLEPWRTSVDEHVFRLLRTHQRLMHKCSIPRVRRPRQPFITEGTLQLVKFRRHTRGITRSLGASCRLQDLRHLFGRWRSSVLKWRSLLVPGDAVAEGLCLRLAGAVRALQLSAGELQQFIRADKVAYLRTMADRFCYAAEEGDVQALYRALQCFRPNSGKRRHLHPLEGIRGLHGQPLQSQAEVARRWSEHFGDIEGERIGTVEDLAKPYVEAYNTCVEQPLLRDLPTLQDWEASFSGLHSKKSPGPGGLSAAFVNLDKPAMAAHSFSLCLKVAHQGREPLLWRGGRAFALYKGKGDARLCQSFRSILLSDLLAKRWHKLLRNMALPAFEAAKEDGQFGVCGGTTTSLLSLWVRACQNFLSNRSISHGFLFTDVKNAFYTVMRQFLLGNSDPGQFATWARSVGMGEDHLDLIAAMLLQDGESFPQHIPAFVRARIQDTLSCTWFLTSGDDCPVLTSKGTRPGDPLADLMFAFVLTGILRDCNEGILAI